MNSRLSGLTAILLALLLVVPSVAGAPVAMPAPAIAVPAPLLPAWATPPAAGRLAPDLARALAQADEDETLRAIVVLQEQFPPERAASPASLVAGLQATAARAQAPLRAELETAQAAGLVDAYTPLWIINAIAVQGRPAALRALADHPAVAAVQLDHYRQWLPPFASSPAPLAPSTPAEWNIERIRAPEVWNALHVDGAGVVVASMDSGVDWLHPALQTGYRGYNPHGLHSHIGNWFDVVNGSLYPIDDHGHGTHTTGTAVGQGGIGVAPGARWIAVKVFSREGYAYDSWLHLGFQWLLAPAGDPQRAPDVVNCSWGNNAGYLTTFQTDLRALRAASIMAVFANGNAGPAPGTVGSPASLPEAFAVGATDSYDDVALFSSRGPSPWGQVRPHVAAPGVGVRSSLPGGVYGLGSGTSMATPHVTGLVALLRSVSPTLSLTRTAELITAHAVPLGSPIPNNDTGWGRIDAFATVVALARPGFISGTVRRADNGAPIASATVTAVPHGGGGGGSALSDSDGAYTMALAPAVYDVTASAFGYVPSTYAGAWVFTATTTTVNFALSPLPAGTLRGQVRDAASGLPLSATVAVVGTPLVTTTAAYSFALPGGVYTVEARRSAYRVVTATATVEVGQVTTVDLSLPPAPTILLVDSGRWGAVSEIGYYRQALDDLAYTYDEWPVRRLPDDVPTAADLSAYDIVLWSAPWDAPGFIGASQTISGYLDGGGRLLLSGQDIGYLDDSLLPQPYYRQYLKVALLDDDAGTRVLTGTVEEMFAGMVITIAGPGGADNQLFPDAVTVLDPDDAIPVLTYGDGLGGVRLGDCLDYRVLYLSFGFEAINSRADRRELLGRTLDWLAAPPSVVGLKLHPAADERIAMPGSVATYTLRVRNMAEVGSNDTFELSLSGAGWPAALSQNRLTLAPCMSATVVLSVTVPADAAPAARDAVTLTVRSMSSGLTQHGVFTTSAPAPILLVDDDLFFEQSAKYRAALEAAGLAYDFWQTCPPVGPCQEKGPPLDVLRRYPIVIWWTGYDWYRPVTTDQEQALADYVAGGGRLMLSSQDYLYYHYGEAFSRQTLGVLRYAESVTPTLARGVRGDALFGAVGPYSLTFPFQNNADGMQPTPGTAVALRDQNREAIALARREGGHATAFFSFPFEALPEAERPTLLAQTVGWLSWLGASTLTADRETVGPGEALTCTLRLVNDGPLTVTASLSNTLPPDTTLVTGSLSGPGVYVPASRRVIWSGPLGAGEEVTISYRLSVSAGLAPGTMLVDVAALTLEEYGIRFQRHAVVRVDAPDLSPSVLGCQPVVRSGRVATCSVQIVNRGAAAPTAAVTVRLPLDSELVTPSLEWEGGGVVSATTATVTWNGPLAAGARVTVSWALTAPRTVEPSWLYSVAFLDDGAGALWERPAWLEVEPFRFYLPVAHRISHIAYRISHIAYRLSPVARRLLPVTAYPPPSSLSETPPKMSNQLNEQRAISDER